MSNHAHGLQQTNDTDNDPRLSAGTRAFLHTLNSPAPPELEKLTPVEARAILVGAQASVDVDYSGIVESEKAIDSGGFRIKLNIVRPEGAGDAILPVFLYLHGGGWVLGDYPTHRRMVRDLVVESGAAAVFVNYTPTPDEQYPRQIDEIYAALEWVAANGAEIGVDGSNLAVAGNSVGGNMTAVTTFKAKENDGPKIKFQLLLWPLTDNDAETESYHSFGERRFLSSKLMAWMFDMYTTDEAVRSSRYHSPLRATVDELRGLPPALVVVAANDILRDEGEAYGRKLDEAGVPVTTTVYDGMIHDFGLLNALAGEPAVKAMFVQAGAMLRKHLFTA